MGEPLESAGAEGDRELVAGRYRLLGLLGAGAMGSVYRASDTELDELVALKVLRRELLGAQGMGERSEPAPGGRNPILERFRREVKLARRVTHANVARVFDIGEHRGERFLTMELVEGESVGCILERERRLTVERAIEIATAVCAGLGAAHAAGVVHRDLKPDNILVARDGRVVVTDFGIARAVLDAADSATATADAIVGTPAYMAPEQVQARRDVDARADVYALGAMLYEMVVGERPWIGETAIAVAAARLVSEPPDPRARRPDLPDALARVIRKCMQRDPADRPSSAQEVASALSALTLPALEAPRALASVRPGASSTSARAGASSRPLFAKSVAVLPFDNLGEPADAFVADALTDELIDALSTTRDVRVCARGTVRGVDRRGDPREIGKALGVQVVIEGAVRRGQGKVYVRARLVSVADGFLLWSRRFERPDGELLVVNEEVAREVLEALTVEEPHAAREMPADPVVVDLYLQARVEYRKGWKENVERAIALFDEALARAPEAPALHAGSAMARARLWFFTGKGGDLARSAAERAVGLAPESAEAHLALATVHLQSGEPEAAVRRARAALARAPALAEAHLVLGRLLLEVGHAAEGVRRIETALELDPSDYQARRELVRQRALSGDWTVVDRMLEHPVGAREHEIARAIDYGRFAMWRRDVAAAKLLRERLEALGIGDGPGPNGIVWGIVALMTSPPEDASDPQYIGSESAGGSGAARRRTFIAQIRAEIAAYFRDVPHALAMVERAVDNGLIDRVWIERCPLLVELGIDAELAPLRATVRQRCERVIAAYSEGSS